MPTARLIVSPLLVALLALSAAACSDSPEEELQAALQAHQDGRLDEAIDLYQEVLTEQPRNRFAWYNLGLIHQTRGQTDAAEAAYRHAISADPLFVPALFNLAILVADRGDDQQAIDLYREIVQIQPEYAAAHLNLGFALIESGDRAAGRRELDTAVGLDPSLSSRIPEGTTASPEPPLDRASASPS